MPQKPRARPPEAQSKQDCRQCQHLSDLDADIETHDVCDQTCFRQHELLELCDETEPMEKTEDQHSDPCVRLKAEKPLESADVIERFINDRETDDGIDDEEVGVNASENTSEQRQTVA